MLRETKTLLLIVPGYAALATALATVPLEAAKRKTSLASMKAGGGKRLAGKRDGKRKQMPPTNSSRLAEGIRRTNEAPAAKPNRFEHPMPRHILQSDEEKGRFGLAYQDPVSGVWWTTVELGNGHQLMTVSAAKKRFDPEARIVEFSPGFDLPTHRAENEHGDFLGWARQDPQTGDWYVTRHSTQVPFAEIRAKYGNAKVVPSALNIPALLAERKQAALKPTRP